MSSECQRDGEILQYGNSWLVFLFFSPSFSSVRLSICPLVRPPTHPPPPPVVLVRGRPMALRRQQRNKTITGQQFFFFFFSSNGLKTNQRKKADLARVDDWIEICFFLLKNINRKNNQLSWMPFSSVFFFVCLFESRKRARFCRFFPPLQNSTSGTVVVVCEVKVVVVVGAVVVWLTADRRDRTGGRGL